LTDGNSVISEEKGCNLIVLTEKWEDRQRDKEKEKMGWSIKIEKK
jgi:hypothetical protein